ncbi:hypothetical protein, partial [Spirosoma terrae]
ESTNNFVIQQSGPVSGAQYSPLSTPQTLLKPAEKIKLLTRSPYKRPASEIFKPGVVWLKNSPLTVYRPVSTKFLLRG